MRDLVNRVAIVTGASRGIGAALAEALAREGCHVVLAARSEQALTALAYRLRQEYAVRTLAVPCDVSDAAQVRHLVAVTEEVFGGVDILINNAGMGLFGAIHELRLADLRHIFDINFFSAVVAMQAVVPSMRSRGGGTIVNVSSIAGKFPSPLGGGYSATKYALQAISGAARAELARDRIDVIVLCAGVTNTEFAQHARISVPGAAGELGERPSPLRGVSPTRVAERTVLAIRRGEREVYVTLLDKLVVTAALALPGLLDWGLRLATVVRRRRFAQFRGEDRRQSIPLVPGAWQWPLRLLAAAGILIGIRLFATRRE